MNVLAQKWPNFGIIGSNITFFVLFLSVTPKSIVLYERKDKNLSLVVPELICTKLQKSIMASFCIFNTRPSKVLNY